MVKVVKKTGTHKLEADYSAWTGSAKIILDGEEILSKLVWTNHKEVIPVGEKKFLVTFGGTILPEVEIQEVLNDNKEFGNARYVNEVEKRQVELPVAEQNTVSKSVQLGNTVDAKSAFGYKGVTILYKVKIENNTAKPISDIKVYPYVPNIFMLKEKDKSISLIEPKSSQTVTFEIRPTGECGDCNVSGRVNYYDTSLMERKDIQLEPKFLSIICPMLHRN